MGPRIAFAAALMLSLAPLAACSNPKSRQATLQAAEALYSTQSGTRSQTLPLLLRLATQSLIFRIEDGQETLFGSGAREDVIFVSRCGVAEEHRP